MDHDDGPDFSYAYGGTPAEPTTSWNPALRPSQAQAPTAQPDIKMSEPRTEPAVEPAVAVESSEEEEDEEDEEEEEDEEAEDEDEDEEDEEEEKEEAEEEAAEEAEEEDEESEENEDEELHTETPASTVPAHASTSVFDKEPKSDEDFFDRFSQSVPQPPVDETNGHRLSGVDEETLANTAQDFNLGVQTGESANKSLSSAHEYAEHENHEDEEEEESSEEESSEEEATEVHPADNYEHQGETTLLEEAVNESVKVPLVADSEAAGDDWGASGEVFDLGGKPQDALLETPLDAALTTSQAEAVGTTVGDYAIGNTTIGGNAGEDIDWGNADDHDFFGVGASTVDPELSSAQESTTTTQAAGTDSIWDIALDDDFLPDNDETSAPFDLDDDEGFLEDEPSQPVQVPQLGARTASKYAPQVSQTPQPASTSSGLQGSQFTDFSQLSQQKSTGTQNVAYGGYDQPSPYQQQPTRPTLPSSAQSFADKAKGGYSSPYDLPEDVITTRKRPAARTTVTAPTLPSTYPPPKTNSVYSNAPPGSSRPPPPMSTTSLSPPSSSHSMLSPMTGMPPNVPPKPAASPKAPSSDFFAELPSTSKPRSSGRYSPAQTAPQHPQTQHVPQHQPAHHAPPMFSPKERTASWSSLRNEVLPDSDNLISQLQQPERLPTFPEQPSAPVRSNSLPVPPTVTAPGTSRYSPAPRAAPAAPSRYSPAPPSTMAAPPAPATRHSPATPSQGPQGLQHGRYVSDPSAASARPPVQPYAPRTSSPLAFHTKPQEQQSMPEQNSQQGSGHHSMLSAESLPRAPFRTPLEGVSEIEEQGQASQPSTPRSGSPPLRSSPSSVVGSPRKRTNYAPQYQPVQPTTPSDMAPPPRAQSQSPSATMKQPIRERPASGHGYISPAANFGALSALHSVTNVIPHRRQASHDFNYIAPTDERASDPLERWKGYPIFKWGFGGATVTSFPKQIPRYGGGASTPMMKCSPGEVKIQSMKEIFPLPEHIPKFPGPLKAKSKKKEVSAWLGQRIEAQEAHLNTPGLEHSVSEEDYKRLEEKVLLWKIMQVLVDNDGLLEGNVSAEAAVRKVLSPERVDSSSNPEGSFATAADLVVKSRSNTIVQAEPIDPRAVEDLRKLLTTGDREKAVWHAVDQRLWAHAMLLSSTLNKDVWKQVVQEFVRKEVKKIGPNSQALAVLYEVFAGNHEDCVDELVPASARAGFQMVSTDGAGPTQNALQGLDKWRETLTLILSNRSDGDAAALLSLGRLLSGYGRVEAAHLCFIFARSVALIGAVDDAQSDIVLVGADHRAYPLDMGNELEPVLLTEVYEFALSLSAQGGSHVVPHLQNYKLAHAYSLAEYGYRADAQAYCDAIAAAMKSTTRLSPYYNGSFVASLDDLSKRLSQSPKDSSSWISKPSMDKVSSSLLSKFNSFIAGDDDEATSNGSAGAEAGPFAKIAGNTPQISPSHSSADLYGAYSGFGVPTPGVSSNSKYAPANAYAPRSSLDQARTSLDHGRPSYIPQGRPSFESMDSSSGMQARSDSYLASPQFSGPYTPSQAQFSPPSQQNQLHKSNSFNNAYQPTSSGEATAATYGGYQPQQANFDQQPTSPPAGSTPSYGGYEPPSTSTSYEPPANSYEPPTNSYEPPAYEPPAYEPYNPDADEKSPVDEPKKKKQFFDDDLDTRADKKEQNKKSEADRKADEAFRKAAEADAKKDNADGKKAGWFGGWFKKDPNASPGPIKAKLGEENSFYYDPELKKWINKKGGASEASKPISTPPPPKSGPPSRSVSGNVAAANHAMGMPSSLPHSGLSTPLSRPPTSNPQRSSSMPPPMGPPSRASTPGVPSDYEGSSAPVLLPPSFVSNGPPSRPSTGMSNASSIDDLLGAVSTNKGTVRKKKKGGRYVDVMAGGRPAE